MNTRATQRSSSAHRQPRGEPVEARTHEMEDENGENQSAPTNTASAQSAGSAAIFTPITAPVLRSVDPVRVALFLKERERYELEVQAKSVEIPSLKPVALTASIDRSLLRSLIYMGELEGVAPGVSAKTVTDEQLSDYILSLVRRSDGEYDPTVLGNALEGLRFPVDICDARARITSYCAIFFERLEGVGYDDFREDNPKQTINLLLQKVQPAALKQKMFLKLKYDRSLEKSVPSFISKLKNEAIACQEYGESVKPSRKGNESTALSASNGSLSSGKRSGKNRSGNRNERRGNGKDEGGGDTSSANARTDSAKDKKEPPVCLWPAHKEAGLRHYIKDCKACPDDRRKELLKEFFDARREGNGAKRAADCTSQPTQSTVLFSAEFGGRLWETLCADIGADANLMDTTLLNRITEAGGDVKIEDLQPARRFTLAASAPDGTDICLVCNQVATMTVDVHIRHGSALKLRHLRWLISPQRVPEPLLGRPILEFLGLNTAEILATAADRSSGVIDTRIVSDIDESCGAGRMSRVLEGLYHGEGEESDATDELPDTNWCDLGNEDDQEWESHLQQRLIDATNGGISSVGRGRLEKMLRDHRDVVRIRLNSRPPAKVTPMSVTLKPNAIPVHAKPRRYPPQKRDFLRKYTTELLRMGFVRPAERTNWVAAPLIVPKKPPAMFRLTMDYRPINAATQKTVWPMPHIDAVLADMRGSRVFAGIDFCSGYWQLPLDNDSQSYFAFMTCDGVVQPTRTTQGGCNSPANFQANVEPCFAALRDHLLAWLDDFVLHGRNEDEHLQNLLRFLDVCVEKNLVISIIKSTFFASTIEWCGRVIDADGVRLNPASLAGLVDACEPRNGAELVQFVYCVNWMSTAIPRFPERVAPLRKLLEKVYKQVGRRTKSAVAKVQLVPMGWTECHTLAFKDLQLQLKNAVKCAHRNQDKTLCLFTDASDEYWAGVVTQCVKAELEKEVPDQKHEPLAFLGGSFTGAQEHWSTYEREAFAILESIRKLDFMFACDESTIIFTDHRNLLFVFHPTAIESTLGRHKVLKVLRWALYLSTFTYRIEHIPGSENVMADIMTRWLRGYRGQRPSIRRLKAPLPVPTAPAPDGEEWPDRLAIIATQGTQEAPPPARATKDEDGLIRCDGRVWLPINADDMKLKLLTIAHCGPSGHRGAESTHESIRTHFTWMGLRRDTSDFVSACLFCVLSKTGAKIPRPLSLTLHASRPNEVLHFDYLYLGGSETGDMYVLVLKDDLSGYCWLEETCSANAEHAASTLARWNRTFTAPSNWVSDQGSHFINETLRLMATDHRIAHHPTVAYAPWTNGTVERLNRDILSAMRALLAELKLAPQNWPTVIALIPTILNEAPLPRLGKSADGATLTPLEVMTGISPRRVMLRVIPDTTASGKAIQLDRARAEQRADITCLQESLNDMHKQVKQNVDERRRRAIDAHNKATNICKERFHVGEFVLVRQAEKTRHKLTFRWAGPRRVVGTTSDVVYLVERLDQSRRERVHSSRMTKYSAIQDGTEVPAAVLELADRTEARYEVLRRITDIADEDTVCWLRLEWDGLPDERDWTWARLTDVHEDVPEMVQEFLHSCTNKKLATSAAAQLGITI